VPESSQIQSGQRHYGNGRQHGRASGLQGQDWCEIIGENVTKNGDGAGLDDTAAGPCEQKSEVTTERSTDEMVLATGVRIRGGELGVAERAYEGKEATSDPHTDKTLHAAGVLCHELRCAENSNAYYQADDECHGIEGREIWPRGHAVRLLRLGSAGLERCCCC
jgi:hypothetical protein